MSDFQAATTAERQVLLLLDAACQVATQLDERRLGVIEQPDRNQKAAVVDTAERLAHLIVVTANRLPDDVGSELREHVQGRLGELRHHLLATGIDLLLGRADEITRMAQVSEEDGERPRGLAGKLAVMLWNVEDALLALGGADSLHDQAYAKLNDARDAVARLQAIEAERDG